MARREKVVFESSFQAAEGRKSLSVLSVKPVPKQPDDAPASKASLTQCSSMAMSFPMSDSLWVKFFPEDWLSDDFVQSLTLQERGAYITLLLHQAAKGPFHESEVMDILGASKWSQAYGELEHTWTTVLKPKFKEENGLLANRKMAAAVADSQKRTEQAKKAAGSRWMSFGGLPVQAKPTFDLEAIWKAFPKREHPTAGKRGGMMLLSNLIKSQEDYDKIMSAVANYSKYLTKTHKSLVDRQTFTSCLDNWLENWEDWLPKTEVTTNADAKPEPKHASLWDEANWCRANKRLLHYPPGNTFPWEKNGSTDILYNEVEAKAKWPEAELRKWLDRERARK